MQENKENMTRQEKKDLLQNYTRICERIEHLEEQLEEIRTAGEKITQSFSSGGSSFAGASKVERAAIKVPELEAELMRCKEKKERIEKAVQGLRGNQRELIRMVYLDNTSQNRVAQLLHKTPNSIRVTVNRAIDDMVL